MVKPKKAVVSIQHFQQLRTGEMENGHVKMLIKNFVLIDELRLEFGTD